MDFTDLSGLSDHAKLNLALGYMVVKGAGQFYSSVRNGGGVIRIGKNFIFGENVPAPIAQDYHAELAPKPAAPPTLSSL